MFRCQPWTSPPRKSNMASRIKSLDTAGRNSADTTHEETNAVQARHARVRRSGRHPEARPSGGDERGLDRHAGRPRRGARCHRRQTGRGALPGPDRRRTRLLHRRQSAGPQQPEAGHEANAGAALETAYPSVPAPAAQSALPDRHLRQRPGGRRRHELRADGRHDPVRALVVFPAGVPPHRPGARLRIDLAAAAADRQGALGGAVADGRAAAGGKGAGMGARQSGL